MRLQVRRERPGDEAQIAEVTATAFAVDGGGRPVEVALVEALRASDAWIRRLSLVAETDRLVGHVVCSRGWVDATEVLALGPLSVHPDVQRRGVGTALMHAVLAAAEALDEPLVALLGHRDYYPRFGFRPGIDVGIHPPVRSWGDHFQVRRLATCPPLLTGEFTYSQPFRDLG